MVLGRCGERVEEAQAARGPETPTPASLSEASQVGPRSKDESRPQAVRAFTLAFNIRLFELSYYVLEMKNSDGKVQIHYSYVVWRRGKQRREDAAAWTHFVEVTATPSVVAQN